MRIKFTSKIRRGLALLAEIATLTEDQPPAFTVMSRWTLKQQREYNAALDWIEQVNKPAATVGRDPTAEEAAMAAAAIGYAPANAPREAVAA